MRGPKTPGWWVALVTIGMVAATVPLVARVDDHFVRGWSFEFLPAYPGETVEDRLQTGEMVLKRLHHPALVMAATATLGMAVLLAGVGRFRPRRGRLGPGALRVLTVSLASGYGMIHHLFAAPDHIAQQWIVGLLSFWDFTMPGVVVGAWVVGRRRSRRWRRDRLDRVAGLVPWLWLA